MQFLDRFLSHFLTPLLSQYLRCNRVQFLLQFTQTRLDGKKLLVSALAVLSHVLVAFISVFVGHRLPLSVVNWFTLTYGALLLFKIYH